MNTKKGTGPTTGQEYALRQCGLDPEDFRQTLTSQIRGIIGNYGRNGTSWTGSKGIRGSIQISTKAQALRLTKIQELNLQEGMKVWWKYGSKHTPYTIETITPEGYVALQGTQRLRAPHSLSLTPW